MDVCRSLQEIIDLTEVISGGMAEERKKRDARRKKFQKAVKIIEESSKFTTRGNNELMRIIEALNADVVQSDAYMDWVRNNVSSIRKQLCAHMKTPSRKSAIRDEIDSRRGSTGTRNRDSSPRRLVKRLVDTFDRVSPRKKIEDESEHLLDELLTQSSKVFSPRPPSRHDASKQRNRARTHYENRLQHQDVLKRKLLDSVDKSRYKL
mgnify:CR=1 FL=1